MCALKTDFEQFPYGDKTIVGERGVSLSGGQRARVNLARLVNMNTFAEYSTDMYTWS